MKSADEDDWLEHGIDADDEPSLIVDRFQLEALLGITPRDVERWTKDGMPVHGKRARGVASKYRVPDCVQWLLAQASDGMQAAKRRQIDVTTKKREAEIKQLESSVVDIDVVEAVLRDAVARFQNELETLPARVPLDCRDDVRKIVTAAINRLAATEIPK